MNPSFLESLERLFRVCRDCALSYEAASMTAQNRELKEFCVDLSEQWGNFVWDLQEELTRAGCERLFDHGRSSDLPVSESLVLRSIDTVQTPAQVMRVCHHNAEEARAGYEAALRVDGLPARLRETLHRHLSEIRGARERELHGGLLHCAG